MQSITLYYSDLATGGTSDKEYRVQIVEQGKGYLVQFQFGRRGGTLQCGDKTPIPVNFEEASNIFNKLVHEKTKNGYVQAAANGEPPARIGVRKGARGFFESQSPSERTPYPIENLEEVATETESDVYLHSPKYWLQVKSNGQFMQVQKLHDGTFRRFNKLGQPVANIPSEILNDLKKLKAKSFFLAGEIIGNIYIVENLLAVNGNEEKTLPRLGYGARFTELERLILASLRHVVIVATWKTLQDKKRGMQTLKDRKAEGAVFKLIHGPYKTGDSGQHKKFKFTKTLSAVVIRKGDKGHNSATLGLIAPATTHNRREGISFFGGDKYIEVGKCSLNGKEEVHIGQVIEVRYLYGTAGNRLYQPRMERIRTDVLPKQCTMSQIIYQGAVA